MPQGLFAHNVQQFVTQNVHAGVAFTKGVCGRIVDQVGAAVSDGGSAFKTAAYSLAGTAKVSFFWIVTFIVEDKWF